MDAFKRAVVLVNARASGYAEIWSHKEVAGRIGLCEPEYHNMAIPTFWDSSARVSHGSPPLHSPILIQFRACMGPSLLQFQKLVTLSTFVASWLLEYSEAVLAFYGKAVSLLIRIKKN